MEEEEEIDLFTNEEDMTTNVFELDFEYEFDAARFFDFTKPESEAEARSSELWFESAPDYPPSPFAVKLFPMKGLYLPISEDDDNMSCVNDDADISQQEHCCYQEASKEKRSQVFENVNPNSHSLDSQKQAGCLFGSSTGQATGFSFDNRLANAMKTKTKLAVKPYMPRSSTLMKPTISQLAKQNSRHQPVDVSGTENQASKRQKLDKDHSRKIVDMKQPTTVTRKIPKKVHLQTEGVVEDAAPQGMNSQRKLRITIPREPDLETAHRAERIRCTSSKEVEKLTSNFCGFRARPLNKKILEAPVFAVSKRSTQHVEDFQGFRFKATQQTNQFACVATPTVPCQNRKILISRGERGVFSSSKRDITAPKEFDFQRSSKNLQEPPVELFSKDRFNAETVTKILFEKIGRPTCTYTGTLVDEVYTRLFIEDCLCKPLSDTSVSYFLNDAIGLLL